MKERKELELWTVSFQWSNPYTNPPENMPRTLLSLTVDRDLFSATRGGMDLPEIRQLFEQYPAGRGWCVSVGKLPSEPNPNLKWSTERKAETRQRNMRRRVGKKWGETEHQPILFPEVVEGEVEKQIASRPDYYAGSDAHVQATEEWIQGIRKSHEELRIKMTKKLESA